ncbi:lysosomal alpha-glucosidase [Caerostris extrusa]|uniref:Lysosomal alpha-glucosidase n=1 Tax=Caerostris extrusa TaxID=172846 RepID=A0AAV4QGI8_CAEEX|nr:lysosomal alpha-glucosidase [Caerostris extrusa]
MLWDVQWNDIDFMNRRLTFTYDPINFKGLPEFVKVFMKRNALCRNVCVSNTEEPHTYAPYDDDAKLDLFLKDVNGSDLEAKVWNVNSTVFPDFSNPNTSSYWAKQFTDFHSKLQFDGAWLCSKRHKKETSFHNISSNFCWTRST